jgi:hypothetical protein
MLDEETKKRFEQMSDEVEKNAGCNRGHMKV